jgi:hypothetical protein
VLRLNERLSLRDMIVSEVGMNDNFMLVYIAK